MHVSASFPADANPAAPVTRAGAASFLRGIAAHWGTRTMAAAAVALAALAIVTLDALSQAPELPNLF